MAGCCEHGNEPSVSIGCEEFLDWLKNLASSHAAALIARGLKRLSMEGFRISHGNIRKAQN